MGNHMTTRLLRLADKVEGVVELTDVANLKLFLMAFIDNFTTLNDLNETT